MGAGVARVGADLDGQEEGEAFPPQFARLHPLPVAHETLIAGAAHQRIVHTLSGGMVAQQLRPVVRVARPLQLQATAGCDERQQSAHLVLKDVEAGDARTAQIRGLQPESFRDDSAAVG